MLVRHDRPRDLRWYLAGPMFFGDLGTSRLYVLGLAIWYAGTAAAYYVAAICTLIVLVGWAYTVVCRVNTDGGGVYSSGRMLHPTLGAVGAMLLFANYVVTAAISTYVAVLYLSAPLGLDRDLAPWISIVAIGLIGALNYVGPRRAGTFALAVGLAAVAFSLLLVVLAGHSIPTGWAAISPPSGTSGVVWLNFVAVILALSGVESVANMTGIMTLPVARTSKLAIWPVVAEVVVLNLVLVVIVSSLPGLSDMGILAQRDPSELTAAEHALKDRVLFVVAQQYLGPIFAGVAGIVFGLLLLSATNTAVVSMISIQYVMSRDGELPEYFSRLNSYGVPRFGLLAACVLPAIVCLIAGDVETLAQLYAIGVVGAIAINLGSCAYNRKLAIRLPERVGMWALGAFLACVWITIALTNIQALVFLIVIVSGGMALRSLTRVVPVPAVDAPTEVLPVEETAEGLRTFDPGKGRVLVATRSNLKLLRFAFDEARRRESNLFVLFVRDLAVLFPGHEHGLRPSEDTEAARLFSATRRMAREFDVAVQEVYCVSPDPADVILDFSATYAADLVILGVSRRASLLRALRGDVIAGVADNLPEESTLLIHA